MKRITKTILTVITAMLAVVGVASLFMPEANEPVVGYSVKQSVHTYVSDNPFKIDTIDYVSHYTSDKNNLIVTLTLDIKESSSILTEQYAQDDAAAVIEYASKNGMLDGLDGIAVVFQADLVDTYGNTETADVLEIYVEHDDIDRINFANFDTSNLAELATDYWKHSAIYGTSL